MAMPGFGGGRVRCDRPSLHSGCSHTGLGSAGGRVLGPGDDTRASISRGAWFDWFVGEYYYIIIM